MAKVVGVSEESRNKFRKTIIERYGSWDAYIEARYNNPLKAEQRKETARMGGEASKQSPRRYDHFTKDNAREMGLRGARARWGYEADDKR